MKSKILTSEIEGENKLGVFSLRDQKSVLNHVDQSTPLTNVTAHFNLPGFGLNGFLEFRSR